MNRVMVTGATGFLGKHLTLRLAAEGNLVHALYRTEEKILGWGHENIRFFKGNLGDADSLDRAMKGCTHVYHVAAFADLWARDSRVFYEENVQGTENVMKSALKHGVKKMVHTSTAGVLGPSNGHMNTEEKQYRGNHFTHYDRSKAMAEEKVREYAESGLAVVIVNPTRIFGPGNLSKSNALTMITGKYLKGKWRIIPGDGESVGNYVYIEDVVDGHLLAMEKGKTGERYLLAGENISFNEYFDMLVSVSGQKYRLFRIPCRVMLLIACILMIPARLTGWVPPITPAFVRRYERNWAVSYEKAKKELGYHPISFRDGIKNTIEWIKS